MTVEASRETVLALVPASGARVLAAAVIERSGLRRRVAWAALALLASERLVAVEEDGGRAWCRRRVAGAPPRAGAS